MRRIGLIATALALCSLTMGQEAAQLTRQLDKTVLYHDIAISSDGTRVAWVQTTAAGPGSVVQRILTGRSERETDGRARRRGFKPERCEPGMVAGRQVTGIFLEFGKWGTDAGMGRLPAIARRPGSGPSYRAMPTDCTGLPMARGSPSCTSKVQVEVDR